MASSVIPWEWESSDWFLTAILVYSAVSLFLAIHWSRSLAEVVFFLSSHCLQTCVFMCISCFLHAPPGSPESRRAVDCAALFGLCLLLAHAWKATCNGLLFAAIFTGLYLVFAINVRLDGSKMTFCEML